MHHNTREELAKKTGEYLDFLTAHKSESEAENFLIHYLGEALKQAVITMSSGTAIIRKKD